MFEDWGSEGTVAAPRQNFYTAALVGALCKGHDARVAVVREIASGNKKRVRHGWVGNRRSECAIAVTQQNIHSIAQGCDSEIENTVAAKIRNSKALDRLILSDRVENGGLEGSVSVAQQDRNADQLPPLGRAFHLR